LPSSKPSRRRKGWKWPWYSSFGSDFNYDFHVTLDENVRPVEYDYRTKAEMIAAKVPNPTKGEEHGLSVFFRIDNDVFHTYSTYARGTEALTDAYALLDRTPYGRQEGLRSLPARLAAEADVRLRVGAGGRNRLKTQQRSMKCNCCSAEL
jgi:predicted dithiol-disulfide oxidoreductase (DUF899 family)